jgi:hypothetical protein
LEEVGASVTESSLFAKEWDARLPECHSRRHDFAKRRHRSLTGRLVSMRRTAYVAVVAARLTSKADPAARRTPGRTGTTATAPELTKRHWMACRTPPRPAPIQSAFGEGPRPRSRGFLI